MGWAQVPPSWVRGTHSGLLTVRTVCSALVPIMRFGAKWFFGWVWDLVGVGGPRQDRHHEHRRGLQDRKSTRLTPVTNAHLVCRLLLEKKKYTIAHII